MFNFLSGIQKLKLIYRFFKKGRLIITASAIFLLCLSAYLGAALVFKAVQIKVELTQLNNINKGKITVVGEGRVLKQPDIAIVTLGINQENSQLSVAQDKANEIINQFIASIRRLKISTKDIETIGYSVYPRYQSDPKTGKRDLVAYLVSERLRVKVRDFHDLNILFQKATDLGLDEANEVRFGFDNDMAIENEARTRAIDNAQKKARLLAQQLGVKLNRLVDFQESDVSPPSSVSRFSTDLPGTENRTSFQIKPSANEVRVKVTLTYRIQYK